MTRIDWKFDLNPTQDLLEAEKVYWLDAPLNLFGKKRLTKA